MPLSLDTILKNQFHEEFSKILFETSSLHLDMCGEDEQIFIDVSEFPKVVIDILSIKEVSEMIDGRLFQDYIQVSAAKTNLMVYYISPTNYLLYDYKESNYEFDLSEEAEAETSKYIKAYANGLIKEAYELSKDDKMPVIFLVHNGEAKIVREDEALLLLSDRIGFDVDAWIEVCIENSPSLVSFLYIDDKKNKVWFNVLNKDYEELLEQFWDEDED